MKPFAPHLASEILEANQSTDCWPSYDESALITATAQVIIQVNGKLRAKIEVDQEALSNEAKITELALTQENVKKYLKGKPRKIIIPKNAKLINIVV